MSNLVFFLAACAFGTYIAGRFQAEGQRRRQLIFVATNLGSATIGLVIGLLSR